MINNKLIKIVKDNQFDKGWTLFHPYDLPLGRNRFFKEVVISDVIKLITFSNTIDIILSDGCLSSRVVSEIEWANKYIKVNAIVKSEDIIKKYKSINFSSVTVDNSIDFNYIGVIGKETRYYMISDGYIEIDDSIEKVYFEKQNLSGDYSFLKTLSNLVIVSSELNKDYSELLKAAQKEKVNCILFVNTNAYNKKTFDYAKANGLDLFVSEFTRDGIILDCKDGNIKSLTLGKGGFFITYPIKDFFEYVGKEYKCDFHDDLVDTKKLTGQVYSCFNGSIKKLNIVDKKVIEIDVPIALMSDFVSETFDSSVVDKHNDYSADTMKVEYLFTLIPPLFDQSYKESSIYDTVHELTKAWNKVQTLKFEKIKSMYFDCLDEDFGLIHLLEEGESTTACLEKREKECDYKNYYSQIQVIKDLYKYYLDNLMEVCKNMFNSINEKSSETKFDKFDNEIAGYRQTISEKNALIEKGVDVLSNKRRVEILSKKIEDLLKLKEHFEGNSASRNDKDTSGFIQHCNDLLNGKKKQVNDDSIGNIVKPKDETKISKLESFADMYLVSIKKYIDDAYVVLLKLLDDVSIPEDYKVYDKKGSRYIIINNLSEFDSTKGLCEKFSLKCITRR